MQAIRTDGQYQPLVVDPQEAYLSVAGTNENIDLAFKNAALYGNKYVVLFLTDNTRTREHLFRTSTKERIHLDWTMTLLRGQQPKYFDNMVFQEIDTT
jgi:hypothetical protein